MMMLKCRELTRMMASDELPEARWPVGGAVILVIGTFFLLGRTPPSS